MIQFIFVQRSHQISLERVLGITDKHYIIENGIKIPFDDAILVVLGTSIVLFKTSDIHPVGTRAIVVGVATTFDGVYYKVQIEGKGTFCTQYVPNDSVTFLIEETSL